MASVRKRRRADGGVSYRVRWVIGGGAAGPGQTEAAETFTSRSRALAFAAEVEEAGHDWPTNQDGVQWVKGPGNVSPTVEVESGPTILQDVTASYFEYQTRMTKLGHLKPYTLHRYRRFYELHLSTTFGPMAFTDIQPLDIEDWMVEQRDLPSTGKSIRNRHGLLFSILMHGQKRLRLRPDNPAELTRLPSKNGELGRQVRFFQHGEWALLRSCLRSDVHLLVDIALATGLRWGELAAMRREDLSFPDTETVRIHVVRAWSKRAPDEDSPINHAAGENRTWKLGPPGPSRTPSPIPGTGYRPPAIPNQEVTARHSGRSPTSNGPSPRQLTHSAHRAGSREQDVTMDASTADEGNGARATLLWFVKQLRPPFRAGGRGRGRRSGSGSV